MSKTRPRDRKSPHLIALFLFTLFSAGGCEYLWDLFPREERVIQKVYETYRKSLKAGDIQRLKDVLVSEKASSLEGPQAAEMLQIIQAFAELPVTISETRIAGETAVLTAQAETEDGLLKGEIHFRRENKAWRLLEEKWDMTIHPRRVILKGGDKTSVFEPLEEPLLSMEWPYDRPESSLVTPPNPTVRIRATLKGHGDAVTGLAFHPDGNWLISSSYGDFTIRLWDLKEEKEVSVVKSNHRPTGIAITPDGTMLIIVDVYGNITFLPILGSDLGTPEVIRAEVGSAGSIAISPNGKLFSIASFDRIVTIGNVMDRTLIRKIETLEPMRAVRFSPSGQILAASTKTNKFILLNLQTGEGRSYTVSKVDKNSDVGSIAFSPSGKWLATGHMDSSIALWNLDLYKEAHNFFVPNQSTWCVAFSPDSKVLATALQGGEIHLWDVASGRLHGGLRGHTAGARVLAFSPDGKNLASGGEDKSILLWR